MSKKLNSLEDLLVEQLRDIYYAEKQQTKALTKMAKKATHEELKTALEDHAGQTESQIERLETVFKELGVAARGKKCPAIDGIVEEGKEIMDSNAEPSVMDAGIICAAQKAEHYEMATYGSLRTFANLLGMNSIADTLQEILDEEGETDKKLTAIAETINVEAAEEVEAEEEEEDENEKY